MHQIDQNTRRIDPQPPAHSVFDQMDFRHSWRDYQARILAEMDHHLSDQKLHIVAAPGAGKTVLGLEIMRRLGLRTLVLAPSVLVRDQWIARLRDDFLDGSLPDWISTDPEADVTLRFSTYQNIHQNRRHQLPGFDLLCLDEAHHLRRAWWQTLTQLERQHQPVTLSLTATPPYDADGVEWANYNALCGPVDAEISVPELVGSGDLCAHQDLVYAATASDPAAYLQTCADERNLFQSLRDNPEIVALVQASPWIEDCKLHSVEILENAAVFSAMLIYLRDANAPVPPYAKRLLRLRDAEWPPLDWSWLQVLLTAHLQDLPVNILTDLKACGALRNDRLQLPPAKFADRVELLRDDGARLQATLDIVEHERQSRGHALRLAILVDRIGQSTLTTGAEDAGYNAGALLHALSQSGGSHDVALLTGQVVVLPHALCDGLSGAPIRPAPGYCLFSGTEHRAAVARVNACFDRGDIRVIIGTQSFLGQGWDAPALNALVLGTNLTSFVAINQLRGRALRVDRRVADKSANIWHLAVTPGTEVAGEDIARLTRRFDCFARIDRPASEVRSYFAPKDTVDAQNEFSFALAAGHQNLPAEWRSALHLTEEFQGRLRRETAVRPQLSQHILPRSQLTYWEQVRSIFGAEASDETTRRSLLRMGQMVVESLRENGDIARDHPMRPVLSAGSCGYQMSLSGANRFEESHFHDALQQLLRPLDNPRYIIVVRNGVFRGHFQYFAVPSRFDGNKARAQIFWRNWQGFFGSGQLVYTRTVQGRGSLQSARLSTHARRAETHLQWR